MFSVTEYNDDELRVLKKRAEEILAEPETPGSGPHFMARLLLRKIARRLGEEPPAP